MRIDLERTEKLSFEQFLARFDESVHEQLRAQWAKPHVTGLVEYRCEDMCSSQYGRGRCLSVGPTFTFKSVGEAPHQIDVELASTIKIPLAYCEKEAA